MKRTGTLLRIEYIKARKRPALWITLGVFTFLTAVTILPNVLRAMEGGGQGPPFALPWIWRGVLQPPINFGPFFLAASMILLFAPEFGWKTARQNVIDGLSREHLYFGKCIVLGILMTLYFAVPFASGIAASVITPAPSRAFAEVPDLNHMLGYLVALTLWGSIGFLLATTIRAAGAAMGMMLLYFLVENILTNMLARNPALQPYMDFLPTQLFDTFTRIELYYPDELARANAMRAESGQELLVLPDLWVPVLASLGFVVLFMGVAFVTMRKRDL